MFGFFSKKESDLKKCSLSTCDHPTRPRGAHCNYQNVLLKAFKPQLLMTDKNNVKDYILSNPYGTGLTKLSTVFPIDLDPMEINLKMMQALSSEDRKIIGMKQFGFLKIIGYRDGDIEIVIFYHIAKQSISLFYPNFQE